METKTELQGEWILDKCFLPWIKKSINAALTNTIPLIMVKFQNFFPTAYAPNSNSHTEYWELPSTTTVSNSKWTQTRKTSVIATMMITKKKQWKSMSFIIGSLLQPHAFIRFKPAKALHKYEVALISNFHKDRWLAIHHQGYFPRMDKAPVEPHITLYNCFHRLSSTPNDWVNWSSYVKSAKSPFKSLFSGLLWE